MAKEVKKGTTKKVVTKSATKKAPAKKVAPAAKKVVKKAPAKKTTRVVKTSNKSNITQLVYMFLLILGVSLVMVSLILKWANYIDTTAMVTCLGIALVSLILSAFLKKFSE